MNRRPLLGILAGVILVLSLLTCGSKPMHGFESGPGISGVTVTQQKALAPSPTPTVTPAPASLDTTGDPAFQAPWTTAGMPAITLPSGLSDSGLPLGIQLVAAPFAETTLLSAARWCEEVLDVNLVPPMAA